MQLVLQSWSLVHRKVLISQVAVYMLRFCVMRVCYSSVHITAVLCN